MSASTIAVPRAQRPAIGQVASETAFAFRRQLRAVAAWAAALVVYPAILLSIWPTIRDSKGIQSYVGSLPQGVSRAFGITDYSTAAGYVGGELMGFIAPLLLIIAAITTTVTLTAAYEDAGYAETLLALPVTRSRMLLSRALASLAAMVVIGMAFFAVLSGMGAALTMGLGAGRPADAVTAVVALAVVHGAVAYLGAGLGLGRTRSIGLAAGVALLTYAMNNLLPEVSALSWATRYSPWHWTVGADPLRTGLPVGGVLLTLGVTAALVAAGTAAFARRDVRTP